VNKQSVSVSAPLGIDRTLTYLKAIMQNLSNSAQSEPYKIDSLYTIPSQSKNLTQKFLIITPNQYMTSYLYSTCRIISPSSQIRRIDQKFSQIIEGALKTDESPPVRAHQHIPKADILLATLTNANLFKHANPEFIVLDGVPRYFLCRLKKAQIFKHFPNAKILNITTSIPIPETLEIKFEFQVKVKTLYLRHHSDNDICLMLKQPRSKIVVFPCEKTLKDFAAKFRSNVHFVHFGSHKFWYPLVLTSPQFVVLATISEVEGVFFPFDIWIFYELNASSHIKHARSGAENIFFSN